MTKAKPLQKFFKRRVLGPVIFYNGITNFDRWANCKIRKQFFHPIVIGLNFGNHNNISRSVETRGAPNQAQNRQLLFVRYKAQEAKHIQNEL